MDRAGFGIVHGLAPWLPAAATTTAALLPAAALPAGTAALPRRAAPLKPSDTAEGDGELYRVRLSLPTMMTIPAESEVQKVEDAINAHIHDDLGIADLEMDLELLNLTDYETNMSYGPGIR